MAEKETMNRGWLQTHPDPETGKQQKFAPYTLSENILRRDGSSYESYVNSKINAVAGQMSSSGQATDTKINNLQGEIDNLELRTDALEYKTANIEGADNDTTFYIVGKKTGGTHQVIAKIDQNGVTSVDFTSYNGTTKITSLNDLLNEVIALKNTTRHISTLEGKTQNITATAEQTNITGNITVSNTVTAGVLATNQLMSSNDSGKWYFVDDKSPANIVAQVDSNGITTTQVRFKDIQSGNLLSTLGFDPSTVESITINIS